MSEATGVIHDIGYQRYAGPRLGRGYVFRALYAHGVRTSFGLGRSAKAKIFPWFIIGVVTLVAVVVVAVKAQLGETLMTYVQFADNMAWLILFFVAVLAPELVSRDIGNGVLPLYFSRPLPRADYVLAKLAALVTAVFLLLGGPQLLMFIGSAFAADDMGGVWDEVTALLPGLAYAAMWALLYGSIALLVASLTGKRAFGAGGIVAVFLMTTPIVGVLSVLPSLTVNQLAGLASPATMVTGTGVWLFRDELITAAEGEAGIGIGDFGPLYALASVLLVGLSVLLLQARYRKVAK